MIRYREHGGAHKLEPLFSLHMEAMTDQDLHSKADIAKELAWRDRQIDFLRVRLEEADKEATAARRATLEECAVLAEPKGKRPCDCTRCYCDKSEDAAAVEAWDTATAMAAKFRALAEEGQGE